MKPQLTLTQKRTLKTLSFMSLLCITMLAFNPLQAQTETANNAKTIKGIVSNEDGVLKDVNIIQKGTINGTVTNEKGEFTFPEKLKIGNVLVFSYLGYETQNVKIKANTTFIKLTLNPDLVEIIGALDSNKPYKSKRTN